VWGCATYHGPGVLHTIRGRLNMHSYMDILIGQMVPFTKHTYPLPDNEDPLPRYRSMARVVERAKTGRQKFLDDFFIIIFQMNCSLEVIAMVID